MSEGFGAYWYRLCRKTPQLNDPTTKMTMSVEGFRKQLEKAYKAGQENGRASGGVGGLFGDLFM